MKEGWKNQAIFVPNEIFVIYAEFCSHAQELCNKGGRIQTFGYSPFDSIVNKIVLRVPSYFDNVTSIWFTTCIFVRNLIPTPKGSLRMRIVVSFALRVDLL